MAITIAGSGIVSANIADGTIVSADITDGTIVSADIANGTIVAADIADNQTLGIENFVPQGLICSNDSDASHDVAISVGGVRDATNVVNMTLAAILTKRIDAAWAVGDNNGGLDGTESSGGTPDVYTLYYIWLIKRSDTGVVDALFSESATGPTLPTNYDYKRLIGGVYTNGSANILSFIHSGNYFRYMGDAISEVEDGTMTDEGVETLTFTAVPPLCLAHVYCRVLNGTETNVQSRVGLRTKGSADATGNNSQSWSFMQTGSDTGDGSGTQGFVLADSAKQVEYWTNENAGTASVNVTVFGFTMLTRDNP